MMNDRERKTATSKADDLMSRIKAAQDTADETLKAVKETAEHVSYVGRVFKKIGNGFEWVNDKIVDPALSVVPYAKPVWKAVRDQYSWFCHPSESLPRAMWRGAKNKAGHAVNGVANMFRSEKKPFEPSLLELGDFSRSRAGVAVLVTAFAATPLAEHIPLVGQFIPDPVSDTAVALMYEPPYDAARMGMTALFNGGKLHHETIYLNGKNEIDPKGDVWSVGGCDNKPGCSTEDAVSFRIKPSVMHQAWSFSTGRGPFLPDYVAVPIPNVPSKCDVTSYGVRWRVAKWLNSYPMLLDAQCESIPAAAPIVPAVAPS